MDSAYIELLREKCSICFDSQLDFCMIKCQDQFCRSCFSRYVQEIVRGAWGMASVEIKCPVCSDSLHEDEWRVYVRDEVLQEYDKYNRPFKTLARACPSCQKENLIVERFKGAHSDRSQLFADIVKDLDACMLIPLSTDSGDEARVSRLQTKKFDLLSTISAIFRDDPCYSSSSSRSSSPDRESRESEESDDDDSCLISRIYHLVSQQVFDQMSTFMPQQETLERPKRRRSVSLPLALSSANTSLLTQSPFNKSILAFAKISQRIISLETSQESWKLLQYRHLSRFPQAQCSECCSSFCFQCGESGHHDGYQCLEWMKVLLDLSDTPSPQQPSRRRTRVSFSKQSQMPSPESPRLLNASAAFGSGDIESLRWKYENSKSCPRCCTLISREEGCNKVDCSMCGFRFCWICRSSWSEKCGFYKCKLQPSQVFGDASDKNVELQAPSTPTSPIDSRRKQSENGVPDVETIQARMATRLAQTQQ
eukprot:Partr_v1_DN27619_c0_g1_i7_m65423